MPRLKVKEDHIAALRAAMAPFLNKTTAEVYAEEGLSHTRYVWDAFWAASRQTPSLRELIPEIYQYANDDHLNSVFNLLAKERAHVEVASRAAA